MTSHIPRRKESPATIRPWWQAPVGARWAWIGTRWIFAMGGFVIFCASLLPLDYPADADLGWGAVIPGFGAVAIVLFGLLTDRSWSLGKRIAYAVAVWPLWSASSFASLFLVGWVGGMVGLLPTVAEGQLVAFDIVYQVSYLPFVLFALRRSHLFVAPRE